MENQERNQENQDVETINLELKKSLLEMILRNPPPEGFSATEDFFLRNDIEWIDQQIEFQKNFLKAYDKAIADRLDEIHGDV